MANIKGLADEITKALASYSSEVTKGLEEAKVAAAKNIVKVLKETSPEQTGNYKKGWTTTKIGSTQIVHNKTDYQLTHLLEFGHAKVGGGRVAPKVHLRPAEEKMINEYTKEVEKVVGK